MLGENLGFELRRLLYKMPNKNLATLDKLIRHLPPLQDACLHGGKGYA